MHCGCDLACFSPVPEADKDVQGQYDNGPCPASHPKRLISIFYEVIYQTNLYADRWHSTKHHPFVFAQGGTSNSAEEAPS